MQARQRILELGYGYKSIWECEWDALKAQNPDIQEFVKTLDIQTRLEPRDAFYGGRTETFKLHYKAEGDDYASYRDITSLYPFINKYAW